MAKQLSSAIPLQPACRASQTPSTHMHLWVLDTACTSYHFWVGKTSASAEHSMNGTFTLNVSKYGPGIRSQPQLTAGTVSGPSAVLLTP